MTEKGEEPSALQPIPVPLSRERSSFRRVVNRKMRAIHPAVKGKQQAGLWEVSREIKTVKFQLERRK
jgi:hypothetical protein